MGREERPFELRAWAVAILSGLVWGFRGFLRAIGRVLTGRGGT
jgi:hypothetical protein